jgi:hypothetical protein
MPDPQMTAQYTYHMLRSIQSAAQYILEATSPSTNETFATMLDETKRDIAHQL